MTAVRLKHGEPAGAGALLASRRFGPLFWAQFLSAFNDNAVKNALVLMIAYRAGAAGQMSAQILIPLAGGLFILPFFLCSATAGQLADQHDKAWLIRLIKLSEIALMLAAAAGVVAGSTTVLLAILCVMGVEAAFFGPLKYAILPDLLAPNELLLGNALVEAGTFIAILLGTIAGVLIAGRHGALLVAALIVTVALAAWAASLMIPPTSAAAAQSPVRWNLFAATMRVIREAAEEAVPFRSMLGISWFWLAGAVYLSQFPGYVRFILGGEEAVVTLFLTVFSIGIALGSLMCTRILRGRISAGTVPWGALGIGLVLDRSVAGEPGRDSRRRADQPRPVPRRPRALAHPRRSARHLGRGRDLYRAFVCAAPGRERPPTPGPRHRRQQCDQRGGDGLRGGSNDRADCGRRQRPRPLPADRNCHACRGGVVLAAIAELCAPRSRGRRRWRMTAAADPPRSFARMRGHRRRLSRPVIRARTRLHGNAAISRIAATISRGSDGARSPDRPATATPARRNSGAARRRCARSLTSTTDRSPCVRNRSAVSRALPTVSREWGSISNAACGTP